MKKNKYLLGIILVVIISCSTTSNNKNGIIKNDSIVKNLVNKHQILLTNHAEFKDHSALYGASAFLIHYNNSVYAVTARHLLGRAGGVEPILDISDLNKYLINWTMFPRISVNPITDTVKIGQTKLNYDLLDKDILLLEVENKGYDIWPLEPKFNLPNEGEKLYIIGCAYSENNCKQNIYEVKFDTYDRKQSLLICVSPIKIQLAGFSGAPLLDASGNVVGVLTRGWDEKDKHYIGATFIKEVQTVK